jgi:ABC-type nitrate/sulfonate/bicarbonate transport system substrate-binding protein
MAYGDLNAENAEAITFAHMANGNTTAKNAKKPRLVLYASTANSRTNATTARPGAGVHMVLESIYFPSR